MKSVFAFAAALALGAALSSNAFGQSSAPGSTPSKPNKVAVPPPPPPPGGPDKLVTHTRPPGEPGIPPRGPKPLDDFAARPKDPVKSLDVTCSQSWCMELVIAWCDKRGGSLSTNPDGSITCTVSKGPHVIGSFLGPVQPPKPPRPAADFASTPKPPQKSGLEVTCSSDWCMKSIVAGCDKNGGGLSTNPDGSVTCSM